MNLTQLHKLICGSQDLSQSHAHSADYDVQMILDIFDVLGIQTPDLLVRE